MDFRESYTGCLKTLGVTRPVGLAEADVSAAEARLGVKLPSALRTFYLVTGAWDLNFAHNRLLEPNELRWVNDRLVFYEENEKLAQWGIQRKELSRPDPVVAQGVRDRGRLQWFDEELSCSKFLVLMTYWQTLVGGLGFASVATTEGVFDAVKPGWVLQGNNGPMKIYAKQNSVLGVLYDEEDDVTSLHAAALDLACLTAISDEYEELPWEVILGDEGDDDDDGDDDDGDDDDEPVTPQPGR
jgi:hypothetical protein